LLVRAIAVVVALTRIARAGGGPATDAYDGIADRGIDAHVLADVYATDAIGASRIALRSFDPAANTLALGWLRLRVARRPGAIGFRIDLGAGDTADAYAADDPAVREHPDLTRALSHVGQACATLVVRGVAIDAG
jgi:hypothetical protein